MTNPDESNRNPAEEHRSWLQSTFDLYQRPLVAYAWRLLSGDLESARDCVQETFLSLCQQPRSSVEGHVDAWLFKVCRNRAMDHHRREGRMNQLNQTMESSLASSAQVDPLRSIELDEEHRGVELQILQLSPREQELLTLRMSHGMSYKQIAEITGLSVTNVGFLLHQAISRLKTALASSD
jgi:RNA polymerase sigma-70 factor (ECF subfamily)